MLIDRKKIRDLMKIKGVTQEQLAPILGVKTRAAVGHKLTGLRQLKLPQFYALARYLGVEPEELLEEPGSLASPDPPAPTARADPYIARLLRVAKSLSRGNRRLLLAVAHGLQRSFSSDEGAEIAAPPEIAPATLDTFRHIEADRDRRDRPRRRVRDRRRSGHIRA
jgi:transcriptional regulator with XRE-family HTH domain